MISQIPPFSQGFEYIRTDGQWPFVLTADVHVRFDLPLFGNVSFRDKTGREWARFVGPVLIIREDYAWDGPTCAPKLRSAMLASLVHDVLYQFLFTDGMRCRLTKEDADVALYDIMRLQGSWLRGVFYFAVKTLGGAYLKDRNNVHSVVLP